MPAAFIPVRAGVGVWLSCGNVMLLDCDNVMLRASRRVKVRVQAGLGLRSHCIEAVCTQDVTHITPTQDVKRILKSLPGHS